MAGERAGQAGLLPSEHFVRAPKQGQVSLAA